MTEPRRVYAEREAARVILLDPAGRVLLQEFQPETGRPVWITPGGGLDPGETWEEAASRELREEVGRPAELGPCVWTRVGEFKFRDIYYRQSERFFLARADPFEPNHRGWTAVEVEMIIGHRWWTVEEIEAASDAAFAPRRLAEFLRPLIAGVLPGKPIDVGM